jgi:RNA polymerase sigma-70 factor (ECF subfamily)
VGKPDDKKQPIKGTRSSTGDGRQGFPGTRWSLVVAAGGGQAKPEGRAALESLCRAYWYPIYAFIRRRGHASEVAQDLTQEFFLRVLSGTFLARANPERGRFRSFLLGAVKNFLADSSDRERALKRGGGVMPLPFDFDAGESMYLCEPSHQETPERIFQRKWARAVLDCVMGHLHGEFLRDGKVDQFNRLKSYVAGSGEVKSAELAAELELSEAALKSSIQRLRRRYRDMLRAEVAATVADPSEVDEELRFLLQAISMRVAEVR